MGRKHKAIRLRLYPNKEQTAFIINNIRSCRFVYNHYLNERKTRYEENKENFSRYDCQKDLKELKQQEDFFFLKDADSSSLIYALMNLDVAFKNFFRTPSVGYPKFKSRYNIRQSYSTQKVRIGENYIVLPKIGKVRARGYREFPGGVAKNATVSVTPSGKFFASVLVEYEAEIVPVSVDKDKVLGISFVPSTLFVDSEGNSAEMPKFFKDMSEKLAREQQLLSRMTPGGENYKKQKVKVAKLHEHIANQRNYYIHNLTRRIADNYDLVCIEDISISKMIKDIEFKNARKSILDASWHSFITILDYKLAERGKELIKVTSEGTPLSHICSYCGAVVPKDTSLSKNKWTCEECQTEHIKAQNTAINIREVGYRMYLNSLK